MHVLNWLNIVSVGLCLVVFGLIAMSAPTPSWADDWPQWGGPQRDGYWRETGIVSQFDTQGLLPRVWSTPLAEGYSGPAVATLAGADGSAPKSYVYITDRLRGQERDSQERVFCLDAESGKEIWKHTYPCRYTVSYPAGPRATPVVDPSGLVYTIGAEGHMFCFDARTGAIKWSKEFQKDFGTRLPTWGMAASPLIDGEQLITLVGGAEGATYMSFNKITGDTLWKAVSSPQIGYCPPMIFTFGGKRELIAWHPDAVTALDPANGQTIWEHPWNIQAGLTVPAPRQLGNRLFLTAFYNGPLMLELGDKGSKPSVVWKGKSNSEVQTDGLHSIMPTPIVTDTHIYGVCSYGQLRCLDIKTGARVWETRAATGEGRWWNAFIIPQGDRYFIHNEQGDLIIAELSPAGYKEISRAKLVEPTRPVMRRTTIWSHPAFALKSVFARNDKEIVRVNLAGK